MHRPPLARTKRCPSGRRCGWPRTLKNRLPWHRATRHTCRCPGGGSGRPHRGFVNRARACLRNNHPRRCGVRPHRSRGRHRFGGKWRRRLYRNRRRLCCRRSLSCYLRRLARRRNRLRVRSCYGCLSSWSNWCSRGGKCGPHRRSWYNDSWSWRGYRRLRGWRRCHCRFRLNWRRRYCGTSRRSNWSGWRLLLADGRKHVARAGDVRKINLRLDLVGGWAARACRLGCMSFSPRSTQTRTHLVRFVLFQRTGMGLLFGDPDFRKHIENCFAFDFQLPCQIVDSNLAHPPYLLLRSIR
jgi:hypothetical protein